MTQMAERLPPSAENAIVHSHLRDGDRIRPVVQHGEMIPSLRSVARLIASRSTAAPPEDADDRLRGAR